MAASPIYQAFKRAKCTRLSFILSVQLPASKALLSRIRSCLRGKGLNLSWDFAATYPGEGKEKVNAQAILTRGPHKDLSVLVIWSRAKEGAPSESKRFSELLRCIHEYLPEREGSVWAYFSYDSEKVTSLFRPIRLADQPVIFDEITGITGVKRNPEGKMGYELEMSFEGKRVNHVVRFTQRLELSEDTPLPLLEVASRISMLALKPKEEK
ncbi:MAG: hypothetical protein WB763_11605 [Terriglobia bacterium]|jgi:hypothetical protein